MRTLRALALLVLPGLLACGVQPGPIETTPEPLEPVYKEPTNPTQPDPMPMTDGLPPLPETPPEVFANTYRRDTAVTGVDFDALIAEPSAFAQRTIEVRGVVRASCQVRGCWMEVRSARDAKSRTLTVRFKNYSFFVPLDSRGADVRFQGVVQIQTVPANEIATYESEGYVFDTKNADGSATLLGFTANGVEMWRKK